MKKETGGAAFPQKLEVSDGLGYGGKKTEYFEGMTLRDYFAGKALTGIVIRMADGTDYSDVSKDAYKQADAMLKEREKCQE